jgi:hypothetical protein
MAFRKVLTVSRGNPERGGPREATARPKEAGTETALAAMPPLVLHYSILCPLSALRGLRNLVSNKDLRRVGAT